MSANPAIEAVASVETQTKAYWERFEPEREWRTELRPDFPSGRGYVRSSLSFRLGTALHERVMAVAQQNDFVLYAVFLAGLHAALYKYTGRRDSIIGVPDVSGTLLAGTEPHTALPFFYRLDPDMPANQLIGDMNDCLYETYEHKQALVEALVLRSAGCGSAAGWTPVHLTLGTLHPRGRIEAITQSAHNQLAVCLDQEAATPLTITLVYNASLFEAVTIEKFGQRLIRLIDQIVDRPERPVAQLDLATSAEKLQILAQFNPPGVDYPRYRTLAWLFEQQAERTAGAAAVVFQGRALTYRELNEKANALALLLRQKGVRADTIVGLRVTRSLEMVIGLLGILKAGGAYLPIDPSYSAERAASMLEDSGAKLLLTVGPLNRNFNAAAETLLLDDGRIYAAARQTNPAPVQDETNLAYVIYTSDSKGEPKGVLVNQRSVVNACVWFAHTYDLTRNRRVLQNTGLSAESSVKEIFAPLLHGGTLYLTTERESSEREQFREFIRCNGIQVVQMFPAALQELVLGGGRLDSVRALICVGEPLPRSARREALILGYELYSGYGMAETAADAITAKCDDGGRTIIGKPIANLRAYIIGPDRQLQPAGAPGELYIGGEGLAQGYINRPALTALMFMNDPFEPGGRLYRTGDLARWQPDGAIELLGNIDREVHVRGYHIDLGEIENRLLSHAAVRQAAVVAVNTEIGDKALCAYVVSGPAFEAAELRAYMKEHLPRHMVPLYVVRLESMPLTPCGSVDHRWLPVPGPDNIPRNAPEAPACPAESALARVCDQVLGSADIGMRDDFFDWGGDSMKAIRITLELQKYGYRLDTNVIFDDGTLKNIARHLTRERSASAPDGILDAALLTPERRPGPGSITERRVAWGQAIMLFRPEGFDEACLRSVFRRLLEHHDALRPVFRQENGVGSAEVWPSLPETEAAFTVERLDDAGSSGLDALMASHCIRLQQAIGSMDGPRVRLGLFRTGEGDHLLIVMHALIVDGVSWRIVLEDLALGYRQAAGGRTIRLPESTGSFRDWSAYVQCQEAGEMPQAELAYWDAIMQAEVPPLPASLAFADMGSPRSHVRRVEAALSQESTQTLLKQTGHPTGTEVNVLLLTALGLAFRAWTSEPRVLLQWEDHGRSAVCGELDARRIIGRFASSYPLLLTLSQAEELGTAVKRTKEALRQVPRHGIGFGFWKSAEPGRQWSGKRPEIGFTYWGELDGDWPDGLFILASLPGGYTVSSEEPPSSGIHIDGVIAGGRLQVIFTYNSCKYDEAAMVRLARTFETYLRAAIAYGVWRADSRPKVCGFRIEPGEIERQQTGYSRLAEATAAPAGC